MAPGKNPDKDNEANSRNTLAGVLKHCQSLIDKFREDKSRLTLWVEKIDGYQDFVGLAGELTPEPPVPQELLHSLQWHLNKLELIHNGISFEIDRLNNILGDA